MVGTVGLSIYATDSFAMYVILLLLSIGVLIYFFSYIKCLFSNPENLRSEKFHIRKMELEHGFYGDDQTGVIDIPPNTLTHDTAVEVDK